MTGLGDVMTEEDCPGRARLPPRRPGARAMTGPRSARPRSCGLAGESGGAVQSAILRFRKSRA